MLVELGHYALILALLLAGAQAFFGLAGPALQRERWLAVVPSAACGQFVFVALAVGVLVHAFVNNDFSVRYVAENSNSALPLFYRVTALWGAHEGSMLLWILVLTLWTMALVARSRYLPPAFAARALGVLGVISFCFLLFTLATSNPFARLIPAAPDGNDLNPLLQDPAFAVHPPILYMGYVGFSVSFALACAAMIEGRRDQLWAHWMRPWTVMAWAFLACGIALGSWWAYYELGWGGFWFWDPVENASFMPWLIGTALIHSLAVTDKRGLFKSWTLLLAVTAFSLSLHRHLPGALGRAGVGAFVRRRSQPRRFHPDIAGSHDRRGARTVRLARAADEIGRRLRFHFARVVPVVQQHPADHCRGGGVWRHAGADDRRHARPGNLVGRSAILQSEFPGADPADAVAGGTGHARALAARRAGRGAAAGAAGARRGADPGAGTEPWGVRASAQAHADRCHGRAVDHPGSADRSDRAAAPPPAPAGERGRHVDRAHRLGVFVLGITFVQSNTIERDIALKPGQSAQLGAYQFRYEGGEDIEGPNYEGFRGKVSITRDGVPVTVLYPEKRRYWVQGTVQTTAAIAPGFGRDLLAALGEDVGAGAWSLRLQYRPLIRFVWIGALIMAIGGVTAVIGRRQRGLAAQGARLPPGCGRRRAARRGRRTLNRFLLPLAAFALLLVVLLVGLRRAPDKSHPAVAADRQAARRSSRCRTCSTAPGR